MSTVIHPDYQVVDGYRLPLHTYSADVFRDVLKYKPCDDELFIASYPKTGTTWLQQIVYLIFNHGIPPTDGNDFFSNTPFLEKSGLDAIHRMKRPNAIKTHLPFQLVPYSSRAKYIYVSRNPKDCCVSFYHHTVSSRAYNYKNGQFDPFFELFLKGEVDNGDYFDHQLSWYERRHDPNVLFLIYERMQSDLESAILKIATFMGQQYVESLERDTLGRVVDFSQFGYMKTKVNSYFEDHYKYPHVLVRKGHVGGWRDELSEKQSRLLDAKIELKLSGTEILRYWNEIGCI